jgi:hypothetical protein
VADTLQQLYEKFRDDVAARQIMYWLGRYQNKVSETVIDRAAAAMPDVSPAKVLDVFRELERLKLGVLKLGRRGQKTRILWTTHPGEIGRKFQNLLPATSEDQEEDDFASDAGSDVVSPVDHVADPIKNDIQQLQPGEAERELTRGLLSGEASFRLFVRGKIGVREIERLIKKLELDKEILAEDNTR